MPRPFYTAPSPQAVRDEAKRVAESRDAWSTEVLQLIRNLDEFANLADEQIRQSRVSKAKIQHALALTPMARSRKVAANCRAVLAAAVQPRRACRMAALTGAALLAGCAVPGTPQDDTLCSYIEGKALREDCYAQAQLSRHCRSWKTTRGDLTAEGGELGTIHCIESIHAVGADADSTTDDGF